MGGEDGFAVLEETFTLHWDIFDLLYGASAIAILIVYYLLVLQHNRPIRPQSIRLPKMTPSLIFQQQGATIRKFH